MQSTLNITKYFFETSKKTIKENKKSDNIYLIYQFFIHSNTKRNKEIQMALQINIKNTLIDKIYLLNEKIYTCDELGISQNDMKKVEQININKRILFSDVFNFIEDKLISGYCIFSNADIFFDADLENLFSSGIDKNPCIYAQLRFEHISPNLKKCPLFKTAIKNFRSDSQDSWFMHSKFNIEKKYRNAFKFQFGMRGCDNKLPYLFKILGYDIRNEPYFLKTFHCHNTEIRDYDENSLRLHGPYYHISPFIMKTKHKIDNFELANNVIKKTNFNYKLFWKNENNLFQFGDSNELISTALKNNLKYDKTWNICSINPLITLSTCLFIQLQKINPANQYGIQQLSSQINELMKLLKEEEGIAITSQKSFETLCLQNIHSMENANINLAFTHLSPGYGKTAYRQNEYLKIICNINNKLIPHDALNIYNYIKYNPWTHLLRGKKILIVAPHIDEIKKQIGNEIYNFDFFPDCKFIFIQSPRTYGENISRDFQEEIQELMKKINDVKDDFDVSLLACNGFSNIISGLMKNIHKSSIVVGNILYFWFGIYNKIDFQKRLDVIKLYLNKNWVKSDFEINKEFAI